MYKLDSIIIIVTPKTVIVSMFSVTLCIYNCYNIVNISRVTILTCTTLTC